MRPDPKTLDQFFAFDPETNLLKAAYGSDKAVIPLLKNERITYLHRGRKLKGEEITWALAYGAWPALPIEPVDGNWMNLNPDNWRQAAPAPEDAALQVLPGVYQIGPHSFRVQAKVGGRMRYFGTYPSVQSANARAIAVRTAYPPQPTGRPRGAPVRSKVATLQQERIELEKARVEAENAHLKLILERAAHEGSKTALEELKIPGPGQPPSPDA